MISFKTVKRICCEDISLIENYNQAIADETQIWVCHHRLGTDLNMTRDQLVKEDKYWNVPASELIFLTYDAHNKLHRCGKKQSIETINKRVDKLKGQKRTEEQKKKISDAHKGIKPSDEAKRKISESNKGHIVKEETRKKISESHKGKILSNETKLKISEVQKGKKRVYDNEEHTKYHYIYRNKQYENNE